MRVGSNEVKAENCVKLLLLLGVYFDQKLSFYAHIDKLCGKSGRKLSVLARLSQTLDAPSKMLIFILLLYYHTSNTVNLCGTCVIGK